MKEYNELKKYMIELREDILILSETVNTESQNLDKYLYKIAESNPELYEYLTLSISDIHTNIRNNKIQIIKVLDKIVLVKAEVLAKMILERARYSSWYSKIWYAITFKNVAITLSFFMGTFLLFFTLYEIDAEAITTMSSGLGKFIENIIKELHNVK